MELPYHITIIEEYRLAVQNGYQPLSQYKLFTLDINLRIQIQRELFGKSLISKGNIVQGNDRFYKWCWENSNQVCEECGKPLHNYSSVFVSHILTRGANPEKAHDPRNKNILCYEHHQQWENETQRKKMRIYKMNLYIISLLKMDYEHYTRVN